MPSEVMKLIVSMHYHEMGMTCSSRVAHVGKFIFLFISQRETENTGKRRPSCAVAVAAVLLLLQHAASAAPPAVGSWRRGWGVLSFSNARRCADLLRKREVQIRFQSAHLRAVTGYTGLLPCAQPQTVRPFAGSG